MTFQSRFGSEEWITPYTNDVVKSLIESGKTELVVCSPSFIADCLETTDELGHELVQDAKEWGGNVHTVDCLNMDPQWCKDFAHYTFTQAEGSAQDKEDLEYKLSADDYADSGTHDPGWVGWLERYQQTLDGSFSAVWKPNFTSKYSLESF